MVNTGRRISLYGHDAKTMKHFTLHFDVNEQCDTLDRAWFGEMWFPVQRHTYHVHASVTDDSIADPADLDLDDGCSEPDLCFSKSHVRDPAYALLDSGATHVLCYCQEICYPRVQGPARSLEVTVNLAVGKEKAKCWRNEVYAEDRAHPLLPLGRLMNLQSMSQSDPTQRDTLHLNCSQTSRELLYHLSKQTLYRASPSTHSFCLGCGGIGT